MTYQVDQFLARYPDYDRQTAQDIAAYAQRQGVPFCGVCKDWHHPNEHHSGD